MHAWISQDTAHMHSCGTTVLVRPVCLWRPPPHTPFRPLEDHPRKGRCHPTGHVAPQTTLRTRFPSPNVLLGPPEDFPKAPEGFLRVWPVTLTKPIKRMASGGTGYPSPPVPGDVGSLTNGMGRGNSERREHPGSATQMSGRLFAVKNDLFLSACRGPHMAPSWSYSNIGSMKVRQIGGVLGVNLPTQTTLGPTRGSRHPGQAFFICHRDPSNTPREVWQHWGPTRM